MPALTLPPTGLLTCWESLGGFWLAPPSPSPSTAPGGWVSDTIVGLSTQPTPSPPRTLPAAGRLTMEEENNFS